MGQGQAKNTRAQAINEARKRDWPGITDIFRPDEIAWIPNYSKKTQMFTARPYPYAHGRLRLVHEDHADGGLSILTTYEFFGDKGVILKALVTTRKGEFSGTKSGKLDPGGEVTVEKLETMAVARALYMAGYGVGAPSAEETSHWMQQQDSVSGNGADAGNDAGRADGGKNDALAALKRDYRKALGTYELFADDKERKAWQKKYIGKESSKFWTQAETVKAIKLLAWIAKVGPGYAKLLGVLDQAKQHTGLVKEFLKLMKVEAVTDIEDLSAWEMVLETAAENAGVEFSIADDDIPF